MSQVALVDLAAQIDVGVQQGAHTERLAEQVASLRRVEGMAAELVPIVTATTNLLAAAVAAGFDAPADGLQALAAELAISAAHAERGEVDAGQINELFVRIRSEVSSVESAITIGWRELIDRKVPQRQGLLSLAETFRQLGGVSGLATELKQAVTAAQQLRNLAPSVEQLRQLEALAQRIPEILRDLVGDDASVRAFAERVALGGAALDSLTPQVQEWLRSKGLQQSFKIVPGPPEA